jgi:branched-chain amino acid transport system permease protein
MAIGLSLTWAMLRVISLAHFALILIGAYLTFELTTRTGLDPILTVLITAPLLFVVGAAIQLAFDRLGLSEFNSLIVTFGLLIIAVQVVSNIWTADFQRLDATLNPYSTRALALGPFRFPVPTLLAFGFAVGILGGSHVLLTRTYPGRALRAFAQDRAIASAFGIDHRRLGVLLAGTAGATAAVAGMLVTVASPIIPTLPFEWVGLVFAVVILGGIGNALGTLAAGVLVGSISAVVSVAWSASTAPMVVFGAVVVALLLRPAGLFARRIA